MKTLCNYSFGIIIMVPNYHLFFSFSMARSELDMTPCVCVYPPLANLEGIPRAAFLALVCGRSDGIWLKKLQ